jgi:hypothetical protein
MSRQLQDPDLPARFPMGITGSRDEDGAGMVYVRCNDGTIWLDTGNATVPWRRLPAIPEPTAEEVEAAERAEQQEKEKAERARRAAIEEGLRQHEALQEAVRANQERLREERLGKAVEIQLRADRMLEAQAKLLEEQEDKERHARHVAATEERPLLFSERMGLQRDALQWAARKESERMKRLRPWWLW